jgi:hypothetical protein
MALPVMAYYEVTISNRSVMRSITVRVEAHTEEEAEQIALQGRHSWRVERVKLVKGD